MVKKITVTKIRSAIGRPKKQKATLEALGLKKMNRPVTHNDTPSLRGMVKKVGHLVKIETN